MRGPIVSLIMVTITSHVFVNIFETVDCSAVKFHQGYEKNMSFFLIPKSLKVSKKSEAIGPGIFNHCMKLTRVPLIRVIIGLNLRSG